MHLIAYDAILPTVAGTPLAALPGHAVIGRATLGRGAWLGAGSVIRADGDEVHIGDGFHFGRGATVHIAGGRHPTIVGHRVCVGADAVVHACTLGDEVVVEEAAIVLDGAVVGAGTVLEAGSVVYPRSVLEGGWLYAGRPARAVRALTRDEWRERAQQLRQRNAAAEAGWAACPRAARAAPNAYLAETCSLAGDVTLADSASVWFGCRLDGRAGPITVGERCNVQDNSVLTAGPGSISLGRETTIGHNVVLADCRVGQRCLVGIGSRIAAGTVIEDDSFVAAGTVTEPGQRLDGGRVWGGQPARPIGRLDDARRNAILKTAEVYAGYAREMRAGQAPAVPPGDPAG